MPEYANIYANVIKIVNINIKIYTREALTLKYHRLDIHENIALVKRLTKENEQMHTMKQTNLRMQYNKDKINVAYIHLSCTQLV